MKLAIQFVLSPQTAWESLQEKEPKLYKDFLMPLWGLVVLASFLGGWFITRDSSLELGIKNAIIETFTLFVGFHVASFILNEYINKMTDVEKGLRRTQWFVACSSSLVYLLDMVVALVNDFFFMWLFSLYTFYIVYIGAEIYYKVIPERKVNFMLIASILILGIPLIVKLCLSWIIT
ncbi:MAG: YIP1 family protein [Dysgonomonas sp.]